MAEADEERLAAELEVLEAMYGTSCFAVTGSPDERTPPMNMKVSLQLSTCALTATVPPGYPTVPLQEPHVRAVGPAAGIPREALTALNAELRQRAEELAGDEAIHSLAEWLEEEGRLAIDAASAQARAEAAEVGAEDGGRANEAASGPTQQLLVVRIDHMNRPKQYVGLLESWGQQLGLRGCIIMPTDAGRVRDVIVVLAGRATGELGCVGMSR